MIMRAVSDHSDPEMFVLYRSRYNQEDHFVSYYRGSTKKNHYDGRYGSGRFLTNKSNTQERCSDKLYTEIHTNACTSFDISKMPFTMSNSRSLTK